MNKNISKYGIPALKILLLLGIVALAIWLGKTAHESEFLKDLVRDFGYSGVLIVSVISGFNLAVPVPAISFLPLFLESGLNFFVTIVIISLGMTLADVVAYLFGKTGRQLVDVKAYPVIGRFEKWGTFHRKKFLMLLFLFACFAPIPNEVLLIPLGFTGYKKQEIIPIVFFGNIVFNTLYGFGITSLFQLM